MKVLLNNTVAELLEIRVDFKPSEISERGLPEIRGHFLIFEGVDHAEIRQVVKVECKKQPEWGLVTLIDYDNNITEIYIPDYLIYVGA